MAGKFEIFKDKRGEHRFRLKASNGEIILASEGYKSRSGCLNGIGSVKTNAPDKTRFRVKTSKSKKKFFVLKAGNHKVIGVSELYNSAAACDGGIKSVMKNAPKAKIEG